MLDAAQYEAWLERMRACDELDEEQGHAEADDLLMEIVKAHTPAEFSRDLGTAYNSLTRWYA